MNMTRSTTIARHKQRTWFFEIDSKTVHVILKKHDKKKIGKEKLERRTARRELKEKAGKNLKNNKEIILAQVRNLCKGCCVGDKDVDRSLRRGQITGCQHAMLQKAQQTGDAGKAGQWPLMLKHPTRGWHALCGSHKGEYTDHQADGREGFPTHIIAIE